MEIDIESFKSKFEPAIAKKMSATNTPGMAFTIVHDSKIIYQRGFGSRDLSNLLPYDTDTLNGFGSNTKSMTSLAILMLEETGKLSVDDPISKHLPVKIGHKDNPILIRHLMSHSSGIPNLGSAEVSFKQLNPSMQFPLVPFISWEDLFHHVNGASDELLYSPGEHFFYCNVGYTMLGEIVSRVSGMNFEDFIRQRILDPLGMTRSGFKEEEFVEENNISVPYFSLPSSDNPNEPKIGKFPFSKFIYAPGGLISSTNEIMNYVCMMMNGGEFKDNQIISAELVERVTNPALKSTLPFQGQGDANYGFGWVIVDGFLNDTLIMHGGGIVGGISQMAYLKKQKIAITAISNFGGNPTDDVLIAFCHLLDKNPEDIFPFIKKNKHFGKFVGNYMSYASINRRKVEFEVGVLYFIDETNKIKLPLFPKSDNENECNFYIQTLNSRMDVDFIENEQGIHMTVERNLYHKV